MKKIILAFILVGIVLISGCGQRGLTKKLNYYANEEIINSTLQDINYDVAGVDLIKNQNGFYVLSVAMDTKGNYDKEVLDAYKVMYENGVADYYQVAIVDYEMETSYSFVTTKKTLDDYFSGRIAEEEYLDQVEVKKLI